MGHGPCLRYGRVFPAERSAVCRRAPGGTCSEGRNLREPFRLPYCLSGRKAEGVGPDPGGLPSLRAGEVQEGCGLPTHIRAVPFHN